MNPYSDTPTCGETLSERDKRLAQAAKADAWKHRSDGMRCKTCMWFNPKAVSEERRAEMGYTPSPTGAKLFDLGRCRRHAPSMGGYPVVFVNDWCGDHRIDENKI